MDKCRRPSDVMPVDRQVECEADRIPAAVDAHEARIAAHAARVAKGEPDVEFERQTCYECGRYFMRTVGTRNTICSAECLRVRHVRKTAMYNRRKKARRATATDV